MAVCRLAQVHEINDQTALRNAMGATAAKTNALRNALRRNGVASNVYVAPPAEALAFVPAPTGATEVDEAYKQAAENLANLVRDLRKELEVPDLPFVVGQTGNADNPELWAAQEAITLRPEFKSRSRYVPTRAFLRKPDDSPNKGHGHHWFGNAESYLRAGKGMGVAMVELQAD